MNYRVEAGQSAWEGPGRAGREGVQVGTPETGLVRSWLRRAGEDPGGTGSTK